MVEKGSENANIFHLAGVVPVSGVESDFGFPWHPSLNPVGKNYLAIERAVVECAWAGCETIWVVCDDDTQPLIKHRRNRNRKTGGYLDQIMGFSNTIMMAATPQMLHVVGMQLYFYNQMPKIKEISGNITTILDEVFHKCVGEMAMLTEEFVSANLGNSNFLPLEMPQLCK